VKFFKKSRQFGLLGTDLQLFLSIALEVCDLFAKKIIPPSASIISKTDPTHTNKHD